jgi:hypothetical protein
VSHMVVFTLLNHPKLESLSVRPANLCILGQIIHILRKVRGVDKLLTPKFFLEDEDLKVEKFAQEFIERSFKEIHYLVWDDTQITASLIHNFTKYFKCSK